MYTFILLLGWAAITLSTVLVSAIAAKKYGVQFLTGAMVGSIIIANVTVVKFVDIFGYYVNAAVIIFSMTFLISDLLSEFWGKEEATKAVWAGFIAQVTWVIVSQITILWPTAPFGMEAHESFKALFSTAPRIVLASMTAYLTIQHFDVWLYHKIKHYTKDRYLWLRNNLSTITSQFLDSLVFFTLAFYGTTDFPTMNALMPLIITGWLAKSAIAVLDTPFMYIFRSILRRI